ncbi:SRPBCC family protein [Puniceibacterium sp. IMCC21224]|uniref:SRPBCC family protein n=1 Tax=Puniceibacterium sp. IMCC21224 TaxID=1618204 RepID=UPI00065D0B1F|nr:SRPBCC family protein [Puniceibacterium sp. IMCC21224]KMK64542.1 hypothetical protein IMCC21224_1377 [Puniceibacterium sp. IMCC21224]
MQITNSFTVPRAIDDTWEILNDIPRVAPCLAGASITEQIDSDTYRGQATLSLGPISLAFAGIAHVDERDNTAHRTKLTATGNDGKGRGKAQANVTIEMRSLPDESTEVTVTSMISLSGAIAQYGRGKGLIQNVADQMVHDFANNLAEMLSEDVCPETGVDLGTNVPPHAQPARTLSLWALVRGMLFGWRKKGSSAK